MAGLGGKCAPVLTLLRSIHRCSSLSSSWLSGSYSMPAVGVSTRVFLLHQRQAVFMILQHHLKMSQVSPSSCPTTKDCLPLCRNVSPCSSPVDFLDQLDKQSLEMCSSNHIASYIIRLGHCQMQFLRTYLPWLEASYHVGYKQLLMAGRLEEVSQHINENEQFTYLCNSLRNSYKDCDNTYLAYSTLMLLYLGIPPESSLIHKLLFELRDRIPQMDMQQTSVMARLYLAMPMLDTLTGRRIVCRLTEFFEGKQVWSVEDFNYLCIIVSKMIRLLSADRFLAFFRVAQNLTEQPEYLDDPKYIENLSLALLKIPERFQLNKMAVTQISTQLKDAALRNLNALSYRELRCVCNTVQYMRWQYNDYFRTRCEEHALSLLHNDCTIREVINLLTVCNSRTDKNVLAIFEEKLCSKLDDCDGHLLGHLARCLNEIDPYSISETTWHKLQHIAADHVQSFPDFSGVMVHSLASLFVRRPDVELDVHQKLASYFIDYLQSTDYDMRYDSSVLLYLMLVRGSPGMPEAIFEKMLSSVPRWNMRHISVMMLRLKTFSRRLSSKCERQKDVLHVVLQMRFLELLPKVASLNELCSATRRMIHNYHNQTVLDNTVFRAVINKYEELSTPEMDEITVNDVTGVFLKFKYYLPSLFDDMVNSVNNMDVTLKLKTYTGLLCLLAKVGYKPKEFDDFVRGVLEAWQECHSEQNYRMMVLILYYLSHFKSFPQEELKHIFSLDFLKTVDREVKERHHMIRNDLMMLNRACVLECPDLGVPWFHEQYCSKTVKVRKNAMSKIVNPPLERVLGGEQYLSTAVLSQYFYLIDFMCILDENLQPINKMITNYGVKDTWQRVAILLQTEQRYCLYSKQLDGFNQVKVRHLNLLGYRVVEIPYYEWNTIGLTDFDVHCNYLYKKIFI